MTTNDTVLTKDDIVKGIVATLDDITCRDILVTAVDGGMDDWVHEYDNIKHTTDDQGYLSVSLTPDDPDELEEDEPPEWYAVDYTTIRKGVIRLLRGEVEGAPLTTLQRLSTDLLTGEMFCRCDAADADLIVQAGLFGKVRYS